MKTIYKLVICEGCCFRAKFLVKLFNFPEFSSKCRVILDNLGKIGRSLMDNGGKLGSSLIFYFVAIDDWRLEIHEAEIYTRLGHTVPQEVMSTCKFGNY